MSITSDAIKWKRIESKDKQTSEWVRATGGLERLCYVMDRYKHHQLNIHLPVLISVCSENGSRLYSDVQDALKKAWIRMFLRFSTLSMTIESDEQGMEGVRVVYDERATEEQLDQWISDTFALENDLELTQCLSEDQGEAIMKRINERICTSFIPEGLSRFPIRVRAFRIVEWNGNSTDLMIGLTLCFHHAFFDGTAAYSFVDPLLRSFAEELQAHQTDHPNVFPLLKASPPLPSALEFIPPNVVEQDRSETFASQANDDSDKVKRMVRTTPHLAQSGITLHHSGRSRQSRFHFSKEQTARLIVRAKEERVTLSQVAAVATLKAFVHRLPPSALEGKDHVRYVTMVNTRSHFPMLDSPYLGNCILGTHVDVDLSDVMPNASIEQSLAVARRTTEALRARKADGLNEMMLVETHCHQWFRKQDWQKDNVVSEIGQTTAMLSDGVLDAFVRPSYGDLIHVHGMNIIMANGHNNEISARTSTFAGRLLLTYDYYSEVFDQQDMDRTVQRWANEIFTLLDQK